MRFFVFVFAAIFASVAFAGAPSPTPAPEIKKTVDAVNGHWTGQMTATVPGEKPETFPWTMDCKPIASGIGASCTFDGKASIGKLSQSCLVAWDAESKSVHYMCVTSMGEVHDHRGHWAEHSIAFEPLAGAMDGKPITETLTWDFPNAKTMTTTGVTSMGEGVEMKFEWSGKRK